MAVSKTASRKAAAKKAAKKARKPRPAAKKKSAPARKKRVAAKKAAPPRRTKAAAPVRAKAMVSPAVAGIDERIALLRNNLRDLVEQAASFSGAANEELMSERISDHEAKLASLQKQREDLVRRKA